MERMRSLLQREFRGWVVEKIVDRKRGDIGQGVVAMKPVENGASRLVARWTAGRTLACAARNCAFCIVVASTSRVMALRQYLG